MTGTGIEGYRVYLAHRDGDADLLHRRLANREEFFESLEADPVGSARPIDRQVFLRNLRRRRPERGLPRQMLFLLATAKLNQAERFGVDLGDTYGRIGGEDEPPERVYLALEEHYHTRLLAYVLDIFSLPFQVVVPPLVMRQFVKMEVFLPERFGFPFVGAAEMAGCIMFDELRRVGVEFEIHSGAHLTPSSGRASVTPLRNSLRYFALTLRSAFLTLCASQLADTRH